MAIFYFIFLKKESDSELLNTLSFFYSCEYLGYVQLNRPKFHTDLILKLGDYYYDYYYENIYFTSLLA